MCLSLMLVHDRFKEEGAETSGEKNDWGLSGVFAPVSVC